MVWNATTFDKEVASRFAETPWTKEAEDWIRIDERLPEDHLARRIDQATNLLDLGPLLDSYLGVGRKAYRPDLLLKLVLYESQAKRPSPSQWARDVKENEPLRWLVLGIEPSRSQLYAFRDRIGPYLDAWNAQVLQMAIDLEVTDATRAALDASLEARASCGSVGKPSSRDLRSFFSASEFFAASQFRRTSSVVLAMASPKTCGCLRIIFAVIPSITATISKRPSSAPI